MSGGWSTPKMLASLREECIEMVDAACHTAALSESGDVFVWGDGQSAAGSFKEEHFRPVDAN